MAKQRRQARKHAATPPPAKLERAAPDWPVLALGVAGMVVTGILVWSALSAQALPYCAEGSACEVVQGSRWSRFLGLPLAGWGLAGYLALVLAALARSRTRQRYWTALIATGGAVFSLYLTAISVMVIGATCGYCLASAGLMLAAALSCAREWRSSSRRRGYVSGATAAVIAALLLHVQASGGTRAAADPYLLELAQHLEQRGIRFYGAEWCPHCQEQKALFGAAAAAVPYVECSPHGPKAPRATACELAEINRYPTWIIDGRKIERILPVEQLAGLTGFRPRAPAAAGN